MTTRKHFKQLVRERMRQTGERYTVARRHVSESPSWELRGGLHGDTAAFANVLANLGVEAAGAPLSEAMILGVGGGLGAGYILWEFEAHAARSRVLTLGFRRQWQYPARWASELAARLGLHAEIHETGGAKGAAAALDAQRRAAASTWDAIVDIALPPGDELRALIDAGSADRWPLQSARDEAWELPSLSEPVQAVYEAEVAALARLQQAGA